MSTVSKLGTQPLGVGYGLLIITLSSLVQSTYQFFTGGMFDRLIYMNDLVPYVYRLLSSMSFGVRFIELYLVNFLILASITAFVLVFYVGGFMVARALKFHPPARKSIEDVSKGLGQGQSSKARIVFITSGVEGSLDTSSRDPVMFDWPIPRQQMALDGSKSRKAAKGQNPIETLELAGFDVLKRNSEVPAAVTGHHANKSLIEHTVRVIRNIDKLSDDPLRRVVAIFHDIGKVFSYQQKSSSLEDSSKKVWLAKYRTHEQVSANMLRLMPEFADLNEQDQKVLLDIMYFSSYESLPEHILEDERRMGLLRAINQADSMSVLSEVNDSAENSDQFDLRSEVIKAFPACLINSHDDTNAGMYWPERHLMAILPGRYMWLLAQKLDRSDVNSLQLDIEPKANAAHPGLNALISTLDSLGVLLSEYDGAQAENHLFSVKVGRISFRRVLLIDTEQLAQFIDRSVIARWGRCDYPLKGVKGDSYE